MWHVVFALFAVGILSSRSVEACQRPPDETAFDTEAPEATNIVAVQVESLEIDKANTLEGTHVFRGRIRVLKHYRGFGDFSEISFRNNQCAGLRIDVGAIYLIATNSQQPTIELNPFAAPILHLAGFFTFDPAIVLRSSPTIKRLEEALRGEGTFAITTRETREQMSTTWPSPPIPRP